MLLDRQESILPWCSAAAFDVHEICAQMFISCNLVFFMLHVALANYFFSMKYIIRHEIQQHPSLAISYNIVMFYDESYLYQTIDL
jgi:hypothetical protein